MSKIVASKRVQQSYSVALSVGVRARLRKLATAIGEYKLANKLSVSYPTLLRAMAGMTVRRGTAHIISHNIPLLEKDVTTDTA